MKKNKIKPFFCSSRSSEISTETNKRKKSNDDDDFTLDSLLIFPMNEWMPCCR
jgi:hypothetical protein